MDAKDPNIILIFARGHCIVKKNHPMLSQLIDMLNEGESITLTDLRKLMEPLWDLIEVFGFIQELMKTDTIVLNDLKN